MTDGFIEMETVAILTNILNNIKNSDFEGIWINKNSDFEEKTLYKNSDFVYNKKDRKRMHLEGKATCFKERYMTGFYSGKKNPGEKLR
ncbi:MAG TPA: hypothetical protein H9744_03640 [Candidatus Eisenbergiella stercoravium]|nr:hypothetical protein [Candidatus Eisenbergiella stercoravium]